MLNLKVASVIMMEGDYVNRNYNKNMFQNENQSKQDKRRNDEGDEYQEDANIKSTKYSESVFDN